MARQTAAADDVQTGNDAFEYVREHWQDMGLGMVETDFHDPYLEVARGGSDWTLYLPVTDDEPVLLPHDAINGEPTTERIPEEFQAEGNISEEAAQKLQRAFDAASGGMFPVEEGFNISFIEDKSGYNLIISHTDGSVTIEEE